MHPQHNLLDESKSMFKDQSDSLKLYHYESYRRQ